MLIETFEKLLLNVFGASINIIIMTNILSNYLFIIRPPLQAIYVFRSYFTIFLENIY